MPGKQAKVVTPPMLKRMLRRVARSPFPARDRVMILLSVKAGLRACEIAGLDWSMVLDAQGRVSGTINVRDVIAKKRGGRRIPMHPELRRALERLARHGTGGARDPLVPGLAPQGEQRGELVRGAFQGARLRGLLVALRPAQLHHSRRPQHPPLGLQPARRPAPRGAPVDRDDRALHRRRHLRAAEASQSSLRHAAADLKSRLKKDAAMHPYERWILRRYLANALRASRFVRPPRRDKDIATWIESHARLLGLPDLCPGPCSSRCSRGLDGPIDLASWRAFRAATIVAAREQAPNPSPLQRRLDWLAEACCLTEAQSGVLGLTARASQTPQVSALVEAVNDRLEFGPADGSEFFPFLETNAERRELAAGSRLCQLGLIECQRRRARRSSFGACSLFRGLARAASATSCSADPPAPRWAGATSRTSARCAIWPRALSLPPASSGARAATAPTCSSTVRRAPERASSPRRSARASASPSSFVARLMTRTASRTDASASRRC